MRFPEFQLTRTRGAYLKFSGLDSEEHCLDKDWFRQYPHLVEYNYNSRGYRDDEWPEDKYLPDAIWCVGDSFTVGLGSPRNLTWVHFLSKLSGLRTINVSMDGASNDWISRKAVDILKMFHPRILILHWSYVHRREHHNDLLPDEERRMFSSIEIVDDDDDLRNFFSAVKKVEDAKGHTKVVHSIIPNSGYRDKEEINHTWNSLKGTSWPESIWDLKDDSFQEAIDKSQEFFPQVMKFHSEYMSLPDIVAVRQVDKNRDGLHYGEITSVSFAKYLLGRIS